MQQRKYNLGEQNSPQKKFSCNREKVDFETGQYAAIRGLKLEDNPFRLAHRRLWWNHGFRDATYENQQNNTQINSESTHGHIAKLRSQLNQS